jgi:hypothetical protein
VRLFRSMIDVVRDQINVSLSARNGKLASDPALDLEMNLGRPEDSVLG